MLRIDWSLNILDDFHLNPFNHPSFLENISILTNCIMIWRKESINSIIYLGKNGI